MNIKQNKKILVVSNDAGGAEIMSAYVKNNLKNYSFFCVLGGPAKNIFAKKGLSKYLIAENDKEIEKIFKSNNFDFILTSTSWSSDLEYRFLKYAKKLGVRSAVYLDHWVNYRERFGYPRDDWKNSLPDEIWAGDTYAFELANSLFGGLVEEINLVENLYFEEVKEDYKKKKKYFDGECNSILFLSEPISEKINIFGDKRDKKIDEYKVLDNFLNFLEKNGEKSQIIICFHPSEKKDKYNKILGKYKLNITKSKNTDIYNDFLVSKYIFGMSSMALVVACLCDKKTISFLVNNDSFCFPFEKIYKINNMKDLNNIIK